MQFRGGSVISTSESGWRDSNPRPLRPERSALPSCATPRLCPASLAESSVEPEIHCRVPLRRSSGGSLVPGDEGEQGGLRRAGEADGGEAGGAAAGGDVE